MDKKEHLSSFENCLRGSFDSRIYSRFTKVLKHYIYPLLYKREAPILFVNIFLFSITNITCPITIFVITAMKVSKNIEHVRVKHYKQEIHPPCMITHQSTHLTIYTHALHFVLTLERFGKYTPHLGKNCARKRYDRTSIQSTILEEFTLQKTYPQSQTSFWVLLQIQKQIPTNVNIDL